MNSSQVEKHKVRNQRMDPQMKVLGIWLHWLCTITAIHSLPLSFSTSSGTWGQLPCPTHRAVWIWQIMTGIMVSTNGRGGHSLLFVSSLRRIQKELETSSLFSVHPLSWSELGSISTCYTKRFSRMTCSCSGFWDVGCFWRSISLGMDIRTWTWAKKGEAGGVFKNSLTHLSPKDGV